SMIDDWIAKEKPNIKKADYDEFTFSLELQNTGELTISECYLEMSFVFAEHTKNLPGKEQPSVYKHIGQDKTGFNRENFILSSKEIAFKAERQGKFEPEKKVYPGISVRFPDAHFGVKIRAGSTL